jgi:hypothetical protein
MEYNIEAISAKVHEQWMATKRAKGVVTRKLESGEELMVPYSQLSEEAKDLDRGSVRAVVAAIEELAEGQAGKRGVHELRVGSYSQECFARLGMLRVPHLQRA